VDFKMNANLSNFVDNRLFWATYSPISKAAGIVGEIGVLDVFEIAAYMAVGQTVKGGASVSASCLDKFLKGLSPRRNPMNSETNVEVDLAVRWRVYEDVCWAVYSAVHHRLRQPVGLDDYMFWIGDEPLNWVRGEANWFRGEANHPNLNEFLKSLSPR
jgi:hypothetical protein